MDIYVLNAAVTIIIYLFHLLCIHGHRHFDVEEIFVYGFHMDKEKTILDTNFHPHSEKRFLELITYWQQVQYPSKRRIGILYIGLV